MCDTPTMNPLLPEVDLGFDESPNPSQTKPQVFKLPSLHYDDKNAVMHFVTYLKTAFHDDLFSDPGYPSLSEASRASRLEESQIRRIIHDVNKALELQGYEPFVFEITPVGKKTSDFLDPFFVLAVDMICDPMDKRSNTAIFKQANITSVRFKHLCKDAAHLAYYDARREEMWGSVTKQAEIAIAKNIESRDLQSIKFMYELKNIYRPDSELTLNLTLIISRLMEVLVKFVDPQVLPQVAEEFDKVINAPSKEIAS
jgi:hypothetical protein